MRFLYLQFAYLTPEGYSLGRWLVTQKRMYALGVLSAERTARLEAMGMDWSPSSWEKCFRRFAAGEPVPQWVIRQRRDYREGRLTPEQIRRLEEAGMQWVPAGRRKKTED